MFIGLQSGHYEIENNCDISLRSGTGAPGEKNFNWAITNELAKILIAYNFQVQIDSANANCYANTTGKDFDFYLAIHAESAPPGGNVVAPDPSVDSSNTESKRIVAAINNVYFKDTGIVNDGLVTNDETFYYMWNVLTAKTPCGIIECGALADPHDSVILADHRRVALGIAHGLCDAFGVAWRGDPNLTTTTSTTTSTTTTTTTTLAPVLTPEELLAQIHNIVWGSGFWWTKINNIKKILQK
jgi:hypothetical protein